MILAEIRRLCGEITTPRENERQIAVKEWEKQMRTNSRKTPRRLSRCLLEEVPPLGRARRGRKAGRRGAGQAQ